MKLTFSLALVSHSPLTLIFYASLSFKKSASNQYHMRGNMKHIFIISPILLLCTYVCVFFLHPNYTLSHQAVINLLLWVCCVAQGKKIDATPLAMYNFFIERVKTNLHIVLAMSPIGDAFRNRLRQFPSLINCCTIDWFQV